MAAPRSVLRPLGALLAVVALVLALAACGKDDDKGASASSGDKTTTTAKPDESGEESETPDIVAKDFSLTSATVKAGDDVYVSNTGGATHTVTADDGSFDTGHIAPGKQAEFEAPTKAGTYTYHCAIHSSMTGTLTVQ